MPSRRRPAATLLTALPLLLTACTAAVASAPGGNGGNSAPPPPSVSAVPVLTSANDQPLPLDAYLLNPQQKLDVLKAQALLVSTCMQRFGFDYKPPQVQLPTRSADAPTTRIDSRYGRQDPALMAAWGYHPEGGLLAARTATDGATGGADSRMSPEMTVVATGSASPTAKFGPGGQIVAGVKVPDHGCFGEAAKRLAGSPDAQVGDANAAVSAKLATLDNSRSDPRTQAVFADWSGCMKETGHDYPDPLAAMNDERWWTTDLPSEQERQVATADAACRKRTNLVGVWYAVDRAYQQQAIEADAEAMSRAEATVRAQVRAAQQVLGH
ncbi:hypothetical protein K353_06574 [Kitasatospora sp. SolWspMP-SS2h]|uniref:hypothetical protein n=1 Tax=Kitasatospora sp. SolWspMP-SS2h TaxID=1305729 RepID=UPI000DB9CEC0|nr:hypothetical protein [Kitasatospora sp. SolWspMP-SS2h]RAJ29686.1 hypothetical protein K353_06574 [Kitasatospora sp. SolWspMP-SS2h]